MASIVTYNPYRSPHTPSTTGVFRTTNLAIPDTRENPPPPPNLKDVGSLATWTVSSHKPTCGVNALRDPSLASYWQSDGPQPHHLNIHFFKMVAIAYIRVFLDHTQDESYTPIKLQFLAGTGYHDLTEVCTMKFENPRGWLEVDLSMAGGPPIRGWGGCTLRCMLLEMRILENHQNGKDTHLRGLQLFSVDPAAEHVSQRPTLGGGGLGQAAMLAATESNSTTPNSGASRAKRRDAAHRRMEEDLLWIDEPTLR